MASITLPINAYSESSTGQHYGAVEIGGKSLVSSIGTTAATMRKKLIGEIADALALAKGVSRNQRKYALLCEDGTLLLVHWSVNGCQWCYSVSHGDGKHPCKIYSTADRNHFDCLLEEANRHAVTGYGGVKASFDL